MAQLHWPSIHQRRPHNVLEHAASLEADFKALDASVELSTAKHHRLPSALQRDIIIAIFKSFSDNEYPYELSEAEKNLIGALLLKHITIEATERARDRIPLQQYHDLRKSFQELVQKLSRSDPDSMAITNERGANNPMEPSPLETLHSIRDSVSRGGEAMLPVTSSDETHEGAGRLASFRNHGQLSPEIEVSDRSKKKGRKRKKRDEFRQAEGGDRAILAGDIMGTQHEVDEVDVHQGQLDSVRNNTQLSPEIDEVVDRPKKKGRKRKKRDECKQADGEDRASAVEDHNGTLMNMSTQHGVDEMDVHMDRVYDELETDDQNDHEDLLSMFRDTEAQGEHIRLQLQEYEDGQLEESTTWVAADELEETPIARKHNARTELMEGDTMVNDPNDQAQRPDDRADNQTRGDNSKPIQRPHEVMGEVADLGASSLITFNIEHQAAVNHLYDMGSIGILQKLSSSLDTMRSSGHDAPHSIRFTNILLLDDGNVEVHADADSKEDMQRLSKIRGWDLEFEKSISVPTESYAIETPRINLESLDIRTRKQKAAAIKELLEANLHLVLSLRSVDDIRNVRWCAKQREESNLIIELRTAQQANKILDVGLYIRGKHYICEFAGQKIRRCGRCQTLGHDQMSCSYAHRCGRCGSHHATWLCGSSILHCVNCHGPHQTSDPTCPAVRARRQRLRYTDHCSARGETEHQKPAPDPQSRTAARNPPSPSPMPITPLIKSEIKVEEDQSPLNPGPVREVYQGGAAAQRHTSMSANAQHETYVKAEGSEPTQEMAVAQNNPLDLTLILGRLDELRMAFEQSADPDLTLIHRRFEDLRIAIERSRLPDRTLLQRQLQDLRLLVEPLAVPQHQRSPRRKRRVDEMLTGEPSSNARKRPKHATRARHGRYRDPVPNRGHVPADGDVPPHANALPGQHVPRQRTSRRLRGMRR